MEMKPIVNGLEQEFAEDAVVLQLDAEEPAYAHLQNQWGLRGHPSFAVLDSDEWVTKRFFGPQPEDTLRQAIRAVLDG